MNTQSKTVVFVTGAFVTHRGWDSWKKYFEDKGYITHAPAWPHKDAPTAEELRNRQPNDKALARLTLTELVDHYANFVKNLPEKIVDLNTSQRHHTVVQPEEKGN